MDNPLSMQDRVDVAAVHKMSVLEFAEMLRDVYVHRRGGMAIWLVGAPGISKSAQINAVIRYLQTQFWDFGGCWMNAANAQSVDFVGWPLQHAGLFTANAVPLLFQPNASMGLRGAYPATCPEALMHADTPKSSLPVDQTKLSLMDMKPFSRGISVIDEGGNVAGEDVMASLSMYAHEGRTGMWGVPVGGDAPAWIRIIISNRMEDRTGVLPFPPTLRNRVLKVELTGNFSDMDPFWSTDGMHPWFKAFASEYSSKVFPNGVPEGEEQFCTARSWYEAHEDVMAYLEHGIGIPHATEEDGTPTPWPHYLPAEPDLLALLSPSTNPVVRDMANKFIGIIAGRCGGDVAGMFANYATHMGEAPSYDEIVDGPAAAKLPRHPGVLHYTMHMLLTEIHLLDLDNIVTYVRRMPEGVQAVWIGKMQKAHPFALTQNKAFAKLTEDMGDAGRYSLRG